MTHQAGHLHARLLGAVAERDVARHERHGDIHDCYRHRRLLRAHRGHHDDDGRLLLQASPTGSHQAWHDPVRESCIGKPHEATVIARLLPEKTLRPGSVTWLNAGQAHARRPSNCWVARQAWQRGSTCSITADFHQPYALLCFIPDTKDGKRICRRRDGEGSGRRALRTGLGFRVEGGGSDGGCATSLPILFPPGPPGDILSHMRLAIVAMIATLGPPVLKRVTSGRHGVVMSPRQLFDAATWIRSNVAQLSQGIGRAGDGSAEHRAAHSSGNFQATPLIISDRCIRARRPIASWREDTHQAVVSSEKRMPPDSRRTAGFSVHRSGRHVDRREGSDASS